MSKAKIRQKLEDIFLNKPHELHDLLFPKSVPCKAPTNLVIAYPDFIEWLWTVDSDQLPHVEQELKEGRDFALKREIDKYRRRKPKYESDLAKVLAEVGNHEVGVAVFAEIQRAKSMSGSFVPYVLDPDEDEVNAGVSSDDDSASTSTAMPVIDKHKKIVGYGMGTGSDVTIRFSQDLFGVFSNAPQGTSVPSGPGSAADEILAHELVHASRQMNGVRYRFGVSGGYGNEEEYLAVVIGNIYLSNRNKTVFRKNHSGFDVLPDPDHFLDSHASNLDVRTLLERFYLNQRCFYCALAAIPAGTTPFNPVRTYEQEQQKAGNHPKGNCGCNP
jgi:hypothetical protein